MASVKERIAAARRRRPLLDHAVRTQEHYGGVKAGQQAGAVTYFAFLSFFPVLALAFFAVGLLARVYDEAGDTLTDTLNSLMPGLLGTEEGQTTLAEIEKYAGRVGIVGAVVLLYSGLGWIQAMRQALVVVFEEAEVDEPNFVVAKLRDLVLLLMIGSILLVSVAVAGLVSGFSGDLLGWLGLGAELGWLVQVVTLVLAFGVDMLLFFSLFTLLGRSPAPRSALWSGALLGAIAFEALKVASRFLLQLTQGSPAFQAFGIALIVLVWISYFSQVVLYAAAWAHTSPVARAARPVPEAAPVQGPPSPPVRDRGDEVDHPGAWPFAAGAATMLGLTAVVRRISRGRGQ